MLIMLDLKEPMHLLYHRIRYKDQSCCGLVFLCLFQQIHIRISLPNSKVLKQISKTNIINLNGLHSKTKFGPSLFFKLIPVWIISFCNAKNRHHHCFSCDQQVKDSYHAYFYWRSYTIQITKLKYHFKFGMEECLDFAEIWRN